MDDKDNLNVRDKLAIEILNGFLASSGGDSPQNQIISLFFSNLNYDYGLERLEKLVRVSYICADMMRKVRLTSFE